MTGDRIEVRTLRSGRATTIRTGHPTPPGCHRDTRWAVRRNAPGRPQPLGMARGSVGETRRPLPHRVAGLLVPRRSPRACWGDPRPPRPGASRPVTVEGRPRSPMRRPGRTRDPAHPWPEQPVGGWSSRSRPPHERRPTTRRSSPIGRRRGEPRCPWAPPLLLAPGAPSG